MENLPNVLIKKIVDCLDPKGLAIVAQVSKELRTLVYRPSVWNELYWVPLRQEFFYATGHLPSNARHIGEPTELCFLAWASYKLKPDNEHYMENLPREIIHMSNTKQFMTVLKDYWNANHRPCIHTRHHLWRDVLKHRSHLNDLTHDEVSRIYYRLVSNPTPHDSTNQYRYWLETQLRLLGSYEIMPILPVEQQDKDNDILQILTSKHASQKRARRIAYLKVREHIKQKYYDSYTSLARIGCREFATNESIVTKYYTH